MYFLLHFSSLPHFSWTLYLPFPCSFDPALVAEYLAHPQGLWLTSPSLRPWGGVMVGLGRPVQMLEM